MFLVNLPVGILCWLLMARFMPKTETHERNFDMFGFALLGSRSRHAIGLDRGEQNDWLQSWEIGSSSASPSPPAWMFIVHMVTSKHPLFERTMFADRNFATGCCSWR